jgi:hypothetical protein
MIDAGVFLDSGQFIDALLHLSIDLLAAIFCRIVWIILVAI